LGELNFLTGQTAYLMARATEAGRIHRITRAQFRRLLATEPDLSDILLRTFLARRDLLRDGPAARAIAIVGSELSAESLALRTFAARQRLAHLWLDPDSAAGRALESITLTDNSTGHISEHLCRGLFCLIGARPATEWLAGLALDKAGFIRTDTQLNPEELGAIWTALGRPPLPFETSMPTVFAAGDVRLTSLKRVASAVGEGASAVRSIHTALGPGA